MRTSTVRPRVVRYLCTPELSRPNDLRPRTSTGASLPTLSSNTLRNGNSEVERSEARNGSAPVSATVSSPTTASVLMARGLLGPEDLAPEAAESNAAAGRRREELSPRGNRAEREAPRTPLGRAAGTGAEPASAPEGRRRTNGPRRPSPRGGLRERARRLALMAQTRHRTLSTTLARVPLRTSYACARHPHEC